MNETTHFLRRKDKCSAVGGKSGKMLLAIRKKSAIFNFQISILQIQNTLWR